MDSRPALRRRCAPLRSCVAALRASGPCTPALTALRSASAAAGSSDLDLALRRQLVGPVGDDLLTGLHTAGEHGRRPLGQCDLNGPHLHTLVGVDDIDVRPLRTVLYGSGGNGERATAHVDLQTGVDELVGKEGAIGVVEDGFAAEGAGVGIDLVVDGEEF